jgi:uncharacterized protein
MDQLEHAAKYFASLDHAEFMVLTTYRRTGESVPTTVWFAAADARLYVTTSRLAGKTKRIIARGDVLVAPSDRVGNPEGAALPARARLLAPDEAAPALAALRRKYGAQYDALTSQMDARQAPNTRVFLEITPPQSGRQSES